MPQARVPWSLKFKIDRFLNEGGWCFRFMFGVLFVAFYWKYTHFWKYWDKVSGVSIGYIPWRIKEGDLMPCKSWLKTTSTYQEMYQEKKCQ